MKITLLYGCKVGESDYMEEILYECKGYVNEDKLMTRAEKWAKENNYNRLRVTISNLSEQPNFTQSINI